MKARPVFSFQLNYFLCAVFLFCIEVLIAVYVHDRIIRPYIGDLLVVIFLYALLKSFWDLPVLTAALSVLLFSYVVELSQWAGFINYIGLEQSQLANIVLGNSFEWIDILAYTAGTLCIVVIEWYRSKHAQPCSLTNMPE